MRSTTLFFCLVCALLGASASGCKNDELPPIPATHDPEGNDIVEGAVIAAHEKDGGIRLLKIVHVDDFPLPLDYEFHMIAYDPKGQTFEETQRMWKDKRVKVILDHFTVRRVDFLVRDYRVLFKEPITPEERKPYEDSKRTRMLQR